MKWMDRVYAVVRQIPRGRVASYGQIAALAAIPRGARAVGRAMALCPDGNNVPCHRVVDRQGNTEEAFDLFHRGTQRMMLAAEGVRFLPDGKVDMASCAWDGKMQDQKLWAIE